MDAVELPGDFNPSLKQDAEQFGGEGESTVVPTYHVRVTSADLAHFANNKEEEHLIVGDVALTWREDPPEAAPEGVDVVLFLGSSSLEKLAGGGILNYGIRQINDENQMVHVTKGGISDLFEDDRSPKERLREDQPHLRPYIE